MLVIIVDCGSEVKGKTGEKCRGRKIFSELRPARLWLAREVNLHRAGQGCDESATSAAEGLLSRLVLIHLLALFVQKKCIK
jgi:hypothetical protein